MSENSSLQHEQGQMTRPMRPSYAHQPIVRTKVGDCKTSLRHLRPFTALIGPDKDHGALLSPDRWSRPAAGLP